MPSVVRNSLFWNNKYLNNEDGWDIGKPTPIFVDYENQLVENSKILIPGCGRGYDAIYLSSKGHDVDALDFSSIAIDYLKKTSASKGLVINTIESNFFTLSNKYNNTYDYIFEYTFFCAISPDDRLAYVKKCNDLLKKKGSIIAVFLPLSTQEDSLNPPYQVKKNHVIKYFKDYFNIEFIDKANKSISPRKNNEFFAVLDKK